MDYKGIQGNLEVMGICVHYFHCHDGFMGLFIYKSIDRIQHFKYMQFYCVSILPQ